MQQKLVTLSDSEYTVMHLFWILHNPLTVGQLQDEISKTNPDLASTVHNIVARLKNKGYVVQERKIKVEDRRAAQSYSAIVTLEEYTSYQLKKGFSIADTKNKFIKNVFVSFIKDEEVSEEAIETMLRAIEERRNGSK